MSVNEEETSQKIEPKLPLVRYLLLIILAAAIAGFFALGLDKYLTFDVLRDNRATLDAFFQCFCLVDHYLLKVV